MVQDFILFFFLRFSNCKQKMQKVKLIFSHKLPLTRWEPSNNIFACQILFLRPLQISPTLRSKWTSQKTTQPGEREIVYRGSKMM